jgi:class 3 adenylate cyclase
MINDILDISRIGSGHLDLADELVVLTEVITQAMTIMEERARRANVRIDTILPANLPRMHGGKRALTQVLLNLLSNAIKFTPDGGSIKIIGGKNATGGVSISVTDTGVCISSREIEALGAFITEFRHRVGAAANANGGVIDKFSDDAAMIVFGLDAKSATDRKEAARATLACADAILAEVSEWSAQRTANGADPLHVGVGVHFGEAYCGAIGDEGRLEFTVLGDTVNIAALLEAFTKTVGRPIAASEDVFRAAGVSSDVWEALGPMVLRGRDKTTVVFASDD